jgi:steroid delta-isomerase-like uncharacterized protein
MAKTLIFIIICSFGLTNTGLRAQSAIKGVSTEWIDALNRHDLEFLSGMYTDSIHLESPNWEGIKTGKTQAKEIFQRYFSSIPDLTYEIIHVIEAEDALVIEYYSSGRLQKPEAGTPEYMRGKKYRLRNCTRLDIEHGKISNMVSYFDQVAFLRQVGFFDQPR